MLYVAGQIVLWMILAFLLGLGVGFFVWGVRQRRTAEEAAAALAPTPVVAEVESVTVRPVVRAAEPVPAPVPALPVTPPAGQPAVPVAATPAVGAVEAPPTEPDAAVTAEEPTRRRPRPNRCPKTRPM